MFSEIEKLLVEHLYNNLIKIRNIYDEKVVLIDEEDIFDLAKKGQVEKVNKYQETKSQLIILIESLYLFGTIFANTASRIIYKKIKGKNDRLRDGNTYRKFLNKIDSKYKINSNLKQKIYCFVTYRNKIIGHHDYERARSHFSEGIKIKLCPLGIQFFGDEKDKVDKAQISIDKTLNELGQKYSYKDDKEMVKKITSLFYQIPWDKKEDRKKIENIVDLYGTCESFNVIEIHELFDEYMNELRKNYF